ncbi:MAG: [FeFe] hydrogenase H-cluster maturation GTPase HydF [Bacteroidales bacterium]|jgi:[FeFe] hydrogenase H-cluster maturation GTPase HydF|nr:[FeFe] hydrogenase H-cluster maturation GTPase HydF [Bacteroidales bacterium]
MIKGRENKPHIGIFGRCNAGKSSLINAIAGQSVSIVSEIAGTTTDSVKKTMEIKGIGAVVLIDTAGLDDTSLLGQQRIERTMETFAQIDLAILIITENNFDLPELKFIEQCKKLDIPYIVVGNKKDIFSLSDEIKNKLATNKINSFIEVSAFNKQDIEILTEEIRKAVPATSYQQKKILDDIITPRSVVLLVTPIDSSAPEGRMILPQVQLIRNVLDNNSINIVVKETELEYTLTNVYPHPAIVITDSQAFEFVSRIVPETIPLTSFSIILAKVKGCFNQYLKGTPFIDKLQDNDRILMLESCSHQPTCEDIGRVKLPAWLKKYTGKSLTFDAVAGLSQIERPVSDYAMVIQCGGCMVTHKQLTSRLFPFIEANIPVSNYGLAIAYINNIFYRATSMFPIN